MTALFFLIETLLPVSLMQCLVCVVQSSFTLPLVTEALFDIAPYWLCSHDAGAAQFCIGIRILSEHLYSQPSPRSVSHNASLKGLNN